MEPKKIVMKGSMRRMAREFFDNLAKAASEASSPSLETSNGTEGPFQYTPLTSVSNFRLLHLKREFHPHTVDDTNMPLRGSLVEASIDAPREYYALSYTWGDPALCDSIVIDGRRLRITASCAGALRRMLRGKAHRYIWVDSICINQANTTEALEERGRQVAMMGDIYRKAVQVNVHLGEGDPASDVAIVALNKLATFYAGAKLPGPQREFFRRQYESLADDVLAQTPEYPYGKLHGVFRLPWFSRIWVIQEIVLARNVMFYCGKHLIHLKTMTAGSNFARLPYSKLDSSVTNRHWMSYLDYHDAMNEFLRRKEAGEPLSNFGLNLSGILMPPALMFEATRPEDKINGLHGICKGFGFELPAPDYRKPVATVYTEAARAIIRDEQGLELLSWVCESSGWDWGLPSWVPNFSGCMRRWSPSSPPHITIIGKDNPGISGYTEWQHDLTLDGQALRVKGRRVDIVCASGLPWMTDVSTSMIGGSSIPTEQFMTSFLDSISTWIDVVRGLDDNCRHVEVAVRRVVQKLAHTTHESLTLSAEDLELTVRSLSMLITSSRSGVDLRQTALAGGQESPQYEGLGRFLGKISVHVWRTMFRTLEGYLGLGPHTTQADDICVVFHGSSLAAVVRPCGDGFRYVGPTYVDGIADGKFWGSKSAKDDEWFVLI